MTKQEFERRMERARNLIVSDWEACVALGRVFEDPMIKARRAFCAYFKPDGADSNMPWLEDYGFQWNSGDNMAQLERRLVFLASFKGFCEAYELYKEW